MMLKTMHDDEDNKDDDVANCYCHVGKMPVNDDVHLHCEGLVEVDVVNLVCLCTLCCGACCP